MAEFIDLSLDDIDDIQVPRTYQPYVDAFNKYGDFEFRRRYRFSKNAVNDLANLLEPDLRRISNRRCTVTPELQVLTALRHYGGGSFELMTGDSLGLSQPAVSKAISAVSTAVCNRLGDFIRLPSQAELPNFKRAFFEMAGFPDVVGCIDCTHIRIKKPSENEEQFVNRKNFHSLNVQAVCDVNCRFTNVFVKWPGGAHDSFILRDSSVWEHFESDPTLGIVLGDSGYPCRYWLMTPFESPTTDSQRNYNLALSKTRVLIEDAFGQLKRRFNVLHQESRRKLTNIILDTAACFALHNFGKAINDPIDDFDQVLVDDIHDNLNAGHQGNLPGLRRRDKIANRYFMRPYL